MIGIPISERTRDRLFSRGSKTDTIDQIINQILDITEVNPLDNIPEEFEDYWQLEKYFNINGSFIESHFVGNGNDTVTVRVINGMLSFTLYYKLQDEKFVRYDGKDSLENAESLERTK